MWRINFVGGLIYMIGCVSCEIAVFPKNTAVLKGSRMSLECRTTAGSVVREWSISRSSDPSEVKIFSNWITGSRESQLPRFGINADERGSGELYCNDTQLDDGGTYICAVEEENAIFKYRAEMIVIESEPECSAKMHPDETIRAECRVRFSGNWTPKMEWRRHNTRANHEEGIFFRYGINDFTNKTSSISTLTAPLYTDKDSFIVSCKIFFKHRNVSTNGSATNIPDFVRVWTSPVFGSRGSSVANPYAILETTPTSAQVSDIQGHREQPQNMYYMIAVSSTGGIAVILLIIVATVFLTRRRRKENSESQKEMETIDGGSSDNYDTVPYLYENDEDPIKKIEPYVNKSEDMTQEPLAPYYMASPTGVEGGDGQEKALTSSADEGYEKMIEPIVKETSTRNSQKKDGDSRSYECLTKNNEKSGERLHSPYLELIGDKTEAKSDSRPPLPSNRQNRFPKNTSVCT